MYIQTDERNGITVDYSDSQLQFDELQDYILHQKQVLEREKSRKPKHCSSWAGGMMAV